MFHRNNEVCSMQGKNGVAATIKPKDQSGFTTQ